MTQIAKVIVDVPVMQTDRPYDYLVPTIFDSQIQPGMRVVVPFGNGTRKVQGFVVGLQNDADFEGNLKEIEAVVDFEPVLNDELLQLSYWLAKQTYAFQITCMQTMLPALMKAKYEKIAVLIDEIDEHLRHQLFHDTNERIIDNALTQVEINQIMNLQRKKQVEIRYFVGNRAVAKTIRGIKPMLTFEQYEEARFTLSKTAKKQVVLINYLQKILDTDEKLLKDAKAESQLSTAIFNVGVEKGWLSYTEKEVYRDPYAGVETEATQAMTLTHEQQVAVDQINAQVDNSEDRVFLIEGVTGSGKTEVYLQVIDEALKQGKTALMLVPEISLTPQMVNRVKGRFGNQVAMMHSGLSNTERFDEWRRIQRKEATVVVGARSAIFSPLENIGVIIIDEEHESSYKQDETPRYHARNVAIHRAAYHHCPVVLGSATPSLESRARAEKDVYQLIRMPYRANHMAMPKVNLIDMKIAVKQQTESNFSPELLEKIKERIQKKEQSVLMLNRRGFSSFVMCRDCGFVLKCPNCDISLTLHMDTHSMKCHYCGHNEPIPKICPNCQSKKIRYYGTGTQKVEKELLEKIPQARVLRMDVDTTSRKGSHERILRAFGNKEADILLGTQMIAKGLDFPDVTLVGVLNADTSLSLPNFRAGERTFQLLTQVSGRAGRAEKEGEVIIQTFNPQNYAIQLATKHDYEGFFNQEMRFRHEGNYPPYYFTVLINVSHQDEEAAAKKIFEIQHVLKPILSAKAIILGPTPKSIARMKNRYYYQLVIKYKNEPRLQATLEKLLNDTQVDGPKGYNIAIDNEPLQFM